MGASPVSSAIRGRDGDLVSVRIPTDVRHVEDLLEILATAGFPLNPQLYHRVSDVVVEFPAWECQLPQLRAHLEAVGFAADAIRVCGPLEPL